MFGCHNQITIGIENYGDLVCAHGKQINPGWGENKHIRMGLLAEVSFGDEKRRRSKTTCSLPWPKIIWIYTWMRKWMKRKSIFYVWTKQRFDGLGLFVGWKYSNGTEQQRVNFWCGDSQLNPNKFGHKKKNFNDWFYDVFDWLAFFTYICATSQCCPVLGVNPGGTESHPPDWSAACIWNCPPLLVPICCCCCGCPP